MQKPSNTENETTGRREGKPPRLKKRIRPYACDYHACVVDRGTPCVRVLNDTIMLKYSCYTPVSVGQECLLYLDAETGAEQYYCADVCDPNPCQGEGDVCVLESAECRSGPCPPDALCLAKVLDDDFQ